MKIGVISDTHVPIFATQLPPKLLKKLDECDRVIHAGDFHAYSVYRELASRYNLTAVIGNRDEFPESEEIPERQVIDVGGFKIGITHGFGPPKGVAKRVVRSWKDTPPDLVIFGHSHQAGMHEIDGFKLLNPGSPTDTLSSDRQTYAILELDDEIKISIHDLG